MYVYLGEDLGKAWWRKVSIKRLRKIRPKKWKLRTFAKVAAAVGGTALLGPAVAGLIAKGVAKGVRLTGSAKVARGIARGEGVLMKRQLPATKILGALIKPQAPSAVERAAGRRAVSPTLKAAAAAPGRDAGIMGVLPFAVIALALLSKRRR